jgi:hypothetical protein
LSFPANSSGIAVLFAMTAWLWLNTASATPPWISCSRRCCPH